MSSTFVNVYPISCIISTTFRFPPNYPIKIECHLLGNLSLIQTRLLQPVNLISLPAGELLIFLHLCSFYLVKPAYVYRFALPYQFPGTDQNIR